MFSVSSSSASASVDPDLERAPPPLPTPVIFPHVEIGEPVPEQEFLKNVPRLQGAYARIQKPNDVRKEHLSCLNYSFSEDVPLEELLPSSGEGMSYLPPRTWTHMTLNVKNAKQARSSLDAFPQKHATLSNGTKAPDYEMYNRFVLELHCENEDAIRATTRRKARPNVPPPPLGHFRRFWVHLETMAAFWDASLDNYYEISAKDVEKQTHDSKALRRFSVALGHKDPPSSQQQGGKRYKGRRVSTGSRMPEFFRVDVLRNFVEPIVVQFGCRMQNPKRVPLLQVSNLLIPVTQTASVWRVPQDKSLSKRGVLEGPVFGMQARGEYNFMREPYVPYLDSAREIASLMLIAEERARESRENIVPGKDKWYTSKPRWGGGPGGEFGEAEGNTDIHPHAAKEGKGHHRRPSLASNSSKPSEEAIWRELKPAPSLWEPGHTYLAVGKDRTEECDVVFMVSCVIHHISILKLTVHPCYMDFLTDGKLPKKSGPPSSSWCNPKVQRSKWFDLLNPEDRTEAMRGIWGILAYAMRPGEGNSQDALGRNRSDGHHASIFRRKSSLGSGLDKLRAHSVAF